MLAVNKQLFSPAAAATGVLLTARGAGRPWPVAKRAVDSDLCVQEEAAKGPGRCAANLLEADGDDTERAADDTGRVPRARVVITLRRKDKVAKWTGWKCMPPSARPAAAHAVCRMQHA